ncbi:MAG TPA: enoyl-CoA hydratase-related protein [Phenylobacterium sp.]|jgi:enoyl-CoA hydratase|uniref:enoyl-CoA hydratase-related protein n=1 Tax=Phenylobacterium sp. TaxID=1871053 RepID=UPI002D3707FB|nr:enoyl-CoA hydratase-related protein [Phenylobacterium sp.]HZZ69471.1 enoyl-CoA hydratase-related protein [Phenylobacterium sp.]
MDQATDFHDILYRVEAGVATLTLNRPRYRNAQGYNMLDELDRAFARAAADRDVRVVVVRGAGGHFSSGHDLGTAEDAAYKAALGANPGIEFYDQFKRYNLDLLLRWRDFPKPTIAMVEGYCIYAGWMLAACCDLVFAAEDAQFLPTFLEYMSVPWDIGIRRAKEVCFEARFLPAAEAQAYGLVNRVLPAADLERETYAYAARVCEQTPEQLRFLKIQMNKAQDMQGFTRALEDSYGDFIAMSYLPGVRETRRVEGGRRMTAVDLALRGRRGERPGLTAEPLADQRVL